MNFKLTGMTIDEQLAFLGKGVVDLIRADDLRAKLEKSARTGVPLRVKFGADPTAPKVTIMASVPESLVKRGLSAGEWVREAAAQVGGKGGGRPDA